MTTTRSERVRAGICVALRSGVWFAVLLLALLTSTAAAWAQASWPGYPNNTAISVTSGGNVGIATATPQYALDVKAGGGNGAVPLRVYGQYGSGNNNTQIRFAGHKDGEIWAVGTDIIGASGSRDFHFYDFNGWTSRLTLQSGTGNVGIGTTNPQYLLSVNGAIGAKEVVVTNTGWPDYVFQPGYRLRLLSEVKAYIDANRRLPDFPRKRRSGRRASALATCRPWMLAKIEELTLHMIQAEERSGRLEQENRELRCRIARLEEDGAPVDAGVK